MRDRHAARLEHLRQLSHLWDNYLGIPGTRFRVGLDSLTGLLPIGGDAIGVILSGYIVLRAMQFGIPKRLLLRMVSNIAIDGLVGTVPFLGDFFDTTWKANTRNVRLLESYLNSPGALHKPNPWMFVVLTALLILILVLLIVLLISITQSVWRFLTL